MMLRLVPVWYIRKKVATIEIGIATAMISVLRRSFRKSSSTSTAISTAEEGVVQHLVDRRLDEARLVDAGRDREPVGKLLADALEAAADRPRDLHRVGVALLVDGELDGLVGGRSG